MSPSQTAGKYAASLLERPIASVAACILDWSPYLLSTCPPACSLPYYVGEVIPKRESLLVQTVQGLKARFNIDIRVKHEVVAIDKAAKTLAVKNLATGELLQQPYDRLILAPGAKPIRPPLAGLDAALAGGHVFTLRSIPDTDAIKAKADALLAAAATEATKAGAPPRKPEVVVIGAGSCAMLITKQPPTSHVASESMAYLVYLITYQLRLTLQAAASSAWRWRRCWRCAGVTSQW